MSESLEHVHAVFYAGIIYYMEISFNGALKKSNLFTQFC